MVITEHKITPEGVILTPQEARELAADLLRAIEEAADHGALFPVTVVDGSDNQFEFAVRPR